MRRYLVLACLFLVTGAGLWAQPVNPSRAGDPPVAALITISAPDENGIVRINGATGAVFPGAQVAVRNLLTEEVTYTQAGLTGTFEARLFGPGNTPFWISPATSIPPAQRNQPGSLPGGPGTIVYGPLGEPPAPPLPITQILIDGATMDWQAYPDTLLLRAGEQTAYGLRNTESVYLAFEPLPAEYVWMAVTFTLEGASYRAVFDPRRPEEAATWQRLSPTPADLGTLAIAKTQAEAVEMRIPLRPLRSILGAAVDSATLERIEFLALDDQVLLNVPVAQPLPLFDEVDGIVHTRPRLGADAVRFSTAGPVAQGAAVWQAWGRANRLNFMPGETLQVQMDVTLNAPDLPEALVGISMIGQLTLQPITGADGQPLPGGLNSNNGWSGVLTPSGLPIDNLRSDFVLGEVVVPAPQVQRRDRALLFGLDFDLTLPENLPPGVYGVSFRGYGQVADGERFAWEANGPFGSGSGISRLPLTRLPLALTIGDVTQRRLIWSLFYDHPSDGSRGILARQDQAAAALSNRVRFNSPTYIVPRFADAAGTQPIAYPLEPYLINLLPNAIDSSAAPLIPFEFPGGQLVVKVTRPDGTTDELGRSVIFQNRLSTAAADERAVFGSQSPVDVYRLTTLNSIFTDYRFTQYGPHTIEMTGYIEDRWGSRYEGGGTYEVLVAELLDLNPGVLSGTPFTVNDPVFAGLVTAPGVPADVTITARLYPLDGGAPVEMVRSGQANRAGYFAGEHFRFTEPGEYIIDYEARYTDSAGRLWANSLRSAGVVVRPDSALIARGQRGLGNLIRPLRPAWFSARLYAPDNAAPQFLFPYQTGDVLWYAADSRNTILPVITVQDTVGRYTDWIRAALINYVGQDGLNIERRIARAEVPVLMAGDSAGSYNPVLQPPRSASYTYISAVRPGLTVRQFVQGSDDPALPLYWDMNDPYNAQIGSGLTGDLAGDFVFLFGGAVVRSPEAEVAETAAYAASAFVIEDRSDALGARIFPPYRGAAGGADGGPLLMVRGRPITLFFHPTAIRPGQVLTVGDTLAIAGQVAPTLASEVQITVISPSGVERQFGGTASRTGYYYNPADDLVVDEPGIWSVQITAQHTGTSSAGQVQPPYPTGGVLGTENGRFAVYVIPADAPRLAWNDSRQDFAIPGAVPYNFNFLVPEGWTNVVVDHTVTIPGFVLRDGPLPVSGSSFTFQHNPTNLNAAFPNVEVDARLQGPAAADPVTLTIVVTGVDADGQFRIRSRTFTILYDRLLTLD